MGIENIIKKSSEIAAVGALVATMAGCQTTGNYQQNAQSSREFMGTPISTIGAYQQSGSELQFPAYNIDGRQEKKIIDPDNEKLINWASDNRPDIRDNLLCASGYSIAPNEVVTFKDGSYCVMDLCDKNTYSNSPSRYGGDGGSGTGGGPGGSGTGGGPGGSGPGGGRGADAGGEAGQASGSNGEGRK